MTSILLVRSLHMYDANGKFEVWQITLPCLVHSTELNHPGSYILNTSIDIQKSAVNNQHQKCEIRSSWNLFEHAAKALHSL